MECNKDEALRAKAIAEKKFEAKDLHGAKKFALKAQALFPALDGVGQMIATFDVYLAAEAKIAGEKDWYSILSVSPLASDDTLKRQYKKKVLQLHPDKNKSVGAEGAFQVVKEAWCVLSDKTMRASYDEKRNIKVFPHKSSQSNKPNAAPGTANGFYSFAANAASKARSNKQTGGSAKTAPPPPPPSPPPPPRATPAPPVPHPAKPQTFWTACNKCKMQYEYLRMYLNHNLLCPNCREPFLATEAPMPPPSEAMHAVRDSNNAGTNQNAGTSRNFQWGPFSRTAGAASATASSAAAAQAANVVHQTYEKVRREREEAQAAARREEALRRKYNPLKRNANVSENVHLGTGDIPAAKKMKAAGKDSGIASSAVGSGSAASYSRVPSGTIPFYTKQGVYDFQGTNGGYIWKPRAPTQFNLGRTFSQLDIRGILLERGKILLQDAIKGVKSNSSRGAANGKSIKKQMVKENGGDNGTLASDAAAINKDASAYPVENSSGNSTGADKEDDDPLSYNVPDPDFHDFDKDRTEESFRSDQIWATYDDEDGMPRYYAFIQKVLSLKPFKLKISFLTSRTNGEFGSLNWVSSGFTKTCGDFRIGRYETCDVLNMFSHQIKWGKGPRGVIKIYPQKGDIWAVYRNWSPDWDAHTPDNVLHVYDVVEVLDDYNEDQGISVIPLVKVAGFRTIFQHHQDMKDIKRIPKEEMFRFSHQVPFYRMPAEEAPNVPKDSYELDPAAISKELLQATAETEEAPMSTAD